MSTTSSSTLTSVLTALGGTTGIDVTSAVNAILSADRAPETQWQAQQATLASQTSAINTLQSYSSTLDDQLFALQDVGGVLGTVASSSSNSSIVTATAANGTPSSNHLITVNSLAKTGSWYSASEASSSTALTGSFDLTSGGTTTTIQLGSGVNTLDQLAASINSQSLGVTANVITDSTGARLSLVAQASGSAADFSISGATGLTFQQAAVGANASLTVDGVPISSASNTVTGAIAGVTLSLQSASVGTEVQLSLAPDQNSIASAVNNFVLAYNQLIQGVNSQFSYNSASNTAGPLQSDSTVQALQSALLDSTNYNTGGSTLNTLASLGISTNKDGTLSLNTTTLGNAVQTNSAAVASFFQGTSGNGFASTLTATLNTYTDPSQGAFTVDLKSISSENQDLTNETNTLELYVTSQQSILTAKYNAADIAIQQLPQKIKQLQALLDPNSSNNN
jgi:flagellar hook-associated protein 2